MKVLVLLSCWFLLWFRDPCEAITEDRVPNGQFHNIQHWTGQRERIPSLVKHVQSNVQQRHALVFCRKAQEFCAGAEDHLTATTFSNPNTCLPQTPSRCRPAGLHAESARASVLAPTHGRDSNGSEWAHLAQC